KATYNVSFSFFHIVLYNYLCYNCCTVQRINYKELLLKMKKSTKLIVEKFPYLKKHVNAHENVLARQQVLSEVESALDETFIELIWFFEDPDKNNFDLQKVYKTLSDEWLLFALDVIHVFFKDDIYLIKESLESIIVSDDYVDQAGASRQLIESGLETYTQNKIETYIYRGTFPKEDLLISGKKFWRKSSIEDYAEKNKET